MEGLLCAKFVDSTKDSKFQVKLSQPVKICDITKSEAKSEAKCAHALNQDLFGYFFDFG